MAKTLFVDNSILTPTFMDIFFGNSAITGHRHTGTNDDGSAPLIQPATDLDPVNGKLIPNINLQTTKTESIEVSFDAGSTFPFATTLLLTRVGNIVFCKVAGGGITGTMTSDGDINFRTVGGGVLDLAFWPPPTTRSSVGTGLNDQLVGNKRVPNNFTIDNTTVVSISIYNGETIGAATDWTGDVTIQVGTTYSWVI